MWVGEVRESATCRSQRYRWTLASRVTGQVILPARLPLPVGRGRAVTPPPSTGPLPPHDCKGPRAPTGPPSRPSPRPPPPPETRHLPRGPDSGAAAAGASAVVPVPHLPVQPVAAAAPTTLSARPPPPATPSLPARRRGGAVKKLKKPTASPLGSRGYRD